MEPRFPETCTYIGEPITVQTGGAFVERARIRCQHGLDGERMAIAGLEGTQTDVLVRIETRNGAVWNARLTPAAPEVTVAAASNWFAVASTYLGLGITHILFGVDHLLFVFCLLLLVRDTRKLLLTVTAFTVAHSITLTAATLGIVHVPAAPVEATIALSIVFLARELLSGEANRSGVTRSYPWVVAFSFGLLHGLGFASALAEIGLPQGEIPLALFAFNLGVELGQLAFIAAVLTIWRLLRMIARTARPQPSRGSHCGWPGTRSASRHHSGSSPASHSRCNAADRATFTQRPARRRHMSHRVGRPVRWQLSQQTRKVVSHCGTRAPE